MGDINAAKLRIKTWEKEFVSLNLRVPESADIKTAPDDVKDCYAAYFKYKRQQEQDRKESMKNVSTEVWGDQFNVKQYSVQNALQSAQERFAAKVKSKVFDSPTQPVWRKSLQPLKTPTKSQTDKDENVTEAAAIENESPANQQEDSIQSKSPKIRSPVKDRGFRKTISNFPNRTLNAEWLQRNANIFEAPAQPVDLPAVPSPDVRGEAKLVQRIKVGEIEAFKKKISDIAPEIDSVIKNAQETSAKALEAATPAPKPTTHQSKRITTFEEDFNEEMKNRSDVANVRRAKNHHKFNTGTPKEGEDSTEVESSGTVEPERANSPERISRGGPPRSVFDADQEFETVGEVEEEQLKPKTKRRVARATGRAGVKRGQKNTSDPEPLKPKEPTVRKRKRKDDEEDAPPVYQGAEGTLEEPEEAQPKKPKFTEEYTEDCSGRVQMKFNKTTSLERRRANGTLNDNFVKANLRKKTFARGVKHLNYKKYRFEEWKQAKQQNGEAPESRMQKAQCFKCGGFGHWAKYCFAKPKSADPKEEEEVEEISIPTLEEAAAMAKGIKSQPQVNPVVSQEIAPSKEKEVEVPEKEQEEDSMDDDSPEPSKVSAERPGEFHDNRLGFTSAQPLRLEKKEVLKYLRDDLGFENFRGDQEEVVHRVLRGQSTLLVSSTGSGKSLCYQLPAYIFSVKSSSITLVVSPLISLMEDQVAGLPGKLKAVYLHSGMAQVQREKTLELIRSGKVHAVLVSPEAVVAAGQGGSLLSGLPPISFACIDEAHCLSEWSHNFRPSYLQLHKTLSEKLNVKCVLALTATATKSTCENIAEHLRIGRDGIKGCFKIPKNLMFTASKEMDRDRALLDLLKSDRFALCTSIIIYTTRRDQTERLAALIRTSMQTKLRTAEQLAAMKRQRNKVRDVLEWDAEAYHAGLAPAKRKTVQNKFMKGQIRVVVATVAFGMGIDKADIRAIIHYNMPNSFESYVQEAGRAGRDGNRSDCHLFLEFKSEDRNEIKRHIYADSTDRFVIRKFLKKVFEPMNRLQDALNKMPRFEVALDIQQMVEYLDMKEENVLTLMCFLESHPNKFIQIKQRVYGTCTVKCYGGVNQLASLVKTSPPLAAAMALKKKFGELEDDDKTQPNTMTFPCVEVATFMGWDSKIVKRELKKLEWDDSRVAAGGKYRKSGVMVEFSDLCFHLYISSDLGNMNQDEVLDFLVNRVAQQEDLQLDRVVKVFSAFKHVALKPGAGAEEVDLEKSDKLKQIIESYFNETPLGIELDQSFNKPASDIDEDFIRGSIRSLIHSQHDQTFTGRAIARILHGIQSPNYPAQVWGRLRNVWRSHLEVDFPTLVRLANEEIVKWRTGSGS